MNPSNCLLAAFVLLAAGCVDARIAALGDEDPNVKKGEFHRPGQPCVLCHGEYLREEPIMTVAGTIYAFRAKDDPLPVQGVTVKLTDAFGETFAKGTNCAGNFFITAEEWKPAFPLRAEIEYPVPGSFEATRRVVMSTRISRDGSCGGCHVGLPDQDSPGWVTCAEADLDPPFPPKETNCGGAKP